MLKDKAELLLNRAKNFLVTAEDRFREKDWDLACFLAEQSAQLLLKGILLEIGGDFPNPHSIRKLNALLYQLTGKEDLKFD
jgi:HEPN domain-containing protein